MNKKTTLLGILGLTVVSGAGYLYTSGQASQLPQQIEQYLPETVRSYLPASFSPAQVPAENNIVELEESMPVAEQIADNEISLDNESAEPIDTPDTAMIQPDNTEENLQTLTSDSMISDEAVQPETIEGISGDIITDIEDSVSVAVDSDTRNSEIVANSTEDEVINDEVEREIRELEQQISEVNNQLGGLDQEKLVLEDKFQNVLKQNRALAVKLKEIDEQLKVNMK